MEYATAQRLLEVKVHGPLGPQELGRIFALMVSYAKERHAERLLADFGHSPVLLTMQDYQALMSRLAVGLLASPVCKVARVAPADPVREGWVHAVPGNPADGRPVICV